MKTENIDIVYCVKESGNNEELRFSLRSLKNLPHRKVWIYGYCPEWVNNDKVNFISHQQEGINKWAKSNSSVKRACENGEITDNFILFNDDFFVLRKVDELKNYYHKTLDYRAREIMTRNMWTYSGYCRRLLEESRFLKMNEKPTLNYAVHIPMVFNKNKLKELFDKYPGRVISRAIYGNIWEVGGKDVLDVKIYSLTEAPEKDWDFASTTNESFERGEVGKYIKRKFRSKSEYERD